ncbi:MAG TPA: hypothetical protein VGD23_02040 [Sphingomicrobium sp.]
MFSVLAAPAACAAHQSGRPASPSISDPQAFVCRAFVRPNVQDQPKPLDEIRISKPANRSVNSGAFRFRVLYWDDPYEGRALTTYVYSESTKKLIEKSLFQLDRQKGPVNQFSGGHGFTGLRYVYAPDSAAELQYFCTYV